jgi:hypothetical protein
MNRKKLFPSALDLHQSAIAAMTAVKDKVEASRAEEVPADFFTRREVEALWNLSQSQAGKRINEAIEAGLMERRDFRVLQGKTVKPRPHYRVIQ